MKHEPHHRISKSDCIEMDHEITMEELKVALRQTKRNKCPGPDGISSDFYMMFFNKIGTILLEALQYAIKVGRVHTSSRNGIISLIPKADKSPNFLKNWRPIILLCTDYKLLAKIVSNRLRKVLDEIIDKDQNGFVPGRNINNSVRTILDTITWAERK